MTTNVIKDPCDHDFEFMGLVWSAGHQSPGSASRVMNYEDKFFCKRCLAIEYRNLRQRGTTFERPIVGSSPK